MEQRENLVQKTRRAKVDLKTVGVIHRRDLRKHIHRMEGELRNCEFRNPDGYYGQNTDNAVKAFQRNNGLDPDGIFGPLSKKKLWNLIDRPG